MTKKILVLGAAGRMGRIISFDLSSDYLVTAVDWVLPDSEWFQACDNTEAADLTDYDTLRKYIRECDLVVGALPSDMSFKAMFAAIECGKPMVDLSYMSEDPFVLDRMAKEAKVEILIDAGVAPGLTNLIAGKAWAEHGWITSGQLMVGGMAADKSAPYGYSLTWSPKDLLAEYTRRARYIKSGGILSASALSHITKIDVSGVGELEAFRTDGMRTLLRMKGVFDLVEKTLRWPGHAKAVLPLINNGTFIEEIQKCSEIKDIVVLYCTIHGRTWQMVAPSGDGITAMQRTTAFTCATFTRLVAECGSLPPGILTPEEIGKDEGLFNFVVDNLRGYGLKLEEK